MRARGWGVQVRIKWPCVHVDSNIKIFIMSFYIIQRSQIMTLIPDNLKGARANIGRCFSPQYNLNKPSHYNRFTLHIPILSGIYKNGRALAKVWSYTKRRYCETEKLPLVLHKAANVRELYELKKRYLIDPIARWREANTKTA